MHTPTALVYTAEHTELAKEIASILKIPAVLINKILFPDNEVSYSIDDLDLGDHIAFLASVARHPQTKFMEMLFAIRFLQRSIGAYKITLLLPYIPYARSENGELTVIIDLLQQVGISKLITIDLHNGKILCGTHFPIIHITAVPAIAAKITDNLFEPTELAVVAPDFGATKLMASYAAKLKCSFAVIEKKRENPHTVCTLSLLGSVRDKNVLLADDICSTAATLSSAAMFCREKGAKKVDAAVTHALLVANAKELLEKSGIETLYITNSIPCMAPLEVCQKTVAVSLAIEFAKALSQ